MTPMVKAGFLRIAAVLFAMVAAYNGYRLKKIAAETVGWDWIRGPGYAAEHQTLLLLGVYAAVAVGAILLVLSIKIGNQPPPPKR
jgi:hypothetical protein